MMKKVKKSFLVATCFATLGWSAAYAENSKITHDGSFRFRMEGLSSARINNMGVTAEHKRHEVMMMRMRNKMTYAAQSNLMFNFAPQVYYNAGDMNQGASFLQLFEGNMEYRFGGDYSLTVGRQVLSFGDESVLGEVDWGRGQSFDGIRLGYRHALGSSHLFQARVNSGNSDDSNDHLRDDQRLVGLYNMLELGDYLNPLDLYYIKYTDGNLGDDQNSDVNREVYTTMGLRLSGSMHGFMYALRYNTQSYDFEDRGDGTADKRGEDSSSEMDVEVGYSMGSSSVSVGYTSASKDYHELMPTGHKFLGYADILSRRNIKATRFGLSHAFGDKLSLMFDYHMFSRNDTSSPVYGTDGVETFYAMGNTSDDVGSEMDLTVKYMLTRRLNLHAGWSSFTPGEYAKASRTTMKDEKTQYTYLQLVGNF